jgi:hypothetical protein
VGRLSHLLSEFACFRTYATIVCTKAGEKKKKKNHLYHSSYLIFQYCLICFYVLIWVFVGLWKICCGFNVWKVLGNYTQVLVFTYLCSFSLLLTQAKMVPQMICHKIRINFLKSIILKNIMICE